MDRDPNRTVLVAACGAIAGIACLAATASLPRDAFWIADNGNKALVAERLVESGFTDFDFSHPGARFDPSGRAFPIEAPFAVERNGRPSSVWLPAYPALAAVFVHAIGDVGLTLPAALGVAASAALLAAWLAPVIGAAAAAGAGLVLALATPLFFYGVTVWEHGIAVALALAALLCVARDRFALAGALVAIGVAFRTEMALFGVTLAIGLLTDRRRGAEVAKLAAGAAPFAVAIAAFHLVAYGHLLGPHLSATVASEAGESGGRGAVAAAFAWARAAIGLVAAYGVNALEAVALAAGVAIALALGVFAASRGEEGSRRPALAGIAVALAVWGYGLARLATAPDPLAMLARYNGLALHLPLVALAGAGWLVAWRHSEFASLRAGLAASIAFLVLGTVLGATTRYSSGLHWGPRFLLPAFPALVALAVIAARRLALGGAFAALVAASLVSTAFSTWLLAQQLGEGRRLAETLRSQPERVIVTSHPLLAQQLAQLWNQKPMLLARNASEVATLVGGIASAGEAGFLLLVPPGAGATTSTGGARCELRAEQRGRRLTYLDLDVLGCRIDAHAGRS